MITESKSVNRFIFTIIISQNIWTLLIQFFGNKKPHLAETVIFFGLKYAPGFGLNTHLDIITPIIF